MPEAAVPLPFYATLFAVPVLGWLATGALLRYAAGRWLDIPNERSSHAHPTPRGGGVVFVLLSLLWWLGLAALGAAETAALVALAGGAPVALIGFWDDRRGLSAPVRFAVQFIAAAWALYWLGDWRTLDIGAGVVPLGAATLPLALLWILWLTNLFNFMDGIDGLAASQGVYVLGVGGALLAFAGAPVAALAAIGSAASVLGFLAWNWPPARIFMGDVGSGFLGFSVAVFALWGERSGTVPLLYWWLLATVFFWDATLTLMARMLRRERWWEAHRDHVYQRAVRSGLTHRRVTLTVVVVNIVLFAGIIYPVWQTPARLPWAALLVVPVAIAVWLWLRARFDARMPDRNRDQTGQEWR